MSIDRLFEAAGRHIRSFARPNLDAAEGLDSGAELWRHVPIPGRLGGQAPPIVRWFLTGIRTS